MNRRRCFDPSASIELLRHFPATKFRGLRVAGYWPLPGEMDVIPLLEALNDVGESVCLPCVKEKNAPLFFRQWSKGDDMRLGAFNIHEPLPERPEVSPNLVLLPLLAFSPEGARLGYGGGYYDRTLEALRQKGDVFACGVAYAGQEEPQLPTNEHDQVLDGVLTERYFRTF